MNNLSTLSPQEQDLVISVPYRVGIWISSCDDNTKSKYDDKREMQALEASIGRMSNLHRKMPFAAQVMKGIEGNKKQWLVWQNKADEAKVLADVQAAIEICRAKCAKGDVGQYKQAIWQTGLVVAQSFGEQIDPDNEMHFDRFVAWLGSFVSAPKLAKQPENMSAKEKTALKKLRAILKG